MCVAAAAAVATSCCFGWWAVDKLVDQLNDWLAWDGQNPEYMMIANGQIGTLWQANLEA